MTKKQMPLMMPEWPHPVDVQDIGRSPLRLSIAPDETARKGLVQRLGLDSIESLESDIVLERIQGGAVIHVSGTIRAKVSQLCVVTLEPLPVEVNEEFEAWFTNPDEAVSLARARHDKSISKGQAEMPVLDEKDDPEPTVDGQIDLGELVTQQLSLVLDPYPRKEGAEFKPPEEGGKTAASPLRKNPFAALKDWKTRLEQGDS